jgi:hypothetical protein
VYMTPAKASSAANSAALSLSTLPNAASHPDLDCGCSRDIRPLERLPYCDLTLRLLESIEERIGFPSPKSLCPSRLAYVTLINVLKGSLSQELIEDELTLFTSCREGEFPATKFPANGLLESIRERVCEKRKMTVMEDV